MKLTKGKISKLYNKKKQSLKKKVNKKKGSRRNKTFREKRNIHLARKSLKRFHYKKHKGGAEYEEKNSQESIPKISEDSSADVEKVVNPTSEIIEQPNIENVEQPVDLSATPVESENVEQPVDLSATPMEENNVEQHVDLNASPAVKKRVNPEHINRIGKALNSVTSHPASPLAKHPMGKLLNRLTAKYVEENNVKNPSELSITSLEKPNKTEVINSLSNVVDYITDTVAEKVSKNVLSDKDRETPQDGEKPQDGFDSVNKAAEMMTSSGGKRRKTRKFKISKKNKTKKI